MEQSKNGVISNSEELEFAIFCVENVAAKLNMDAVKIYSVILSR